VDVLWGLYHFLDTHPTETIIASLKVDHGDANDPTLQQILHDQFTTAPTSDYWAQDGSVSVFLAYDLHSVKRAYNLDFRLQSGNLGAKRHKVVLYRRYSFLPDLSPVGIDLSLNWKDNDGDFVINYDSQQSAYIEDLYQINGDNQPPATKIPIKFDAVTRHLDNANGGANLTQLFITFVSGYGAGVGDTMTPKVSLLILQNSHS
jgi:1-phosphatidylinositol phosphodiesterase